ncbi:MAG: peptidylprolyl isomerase [Spirochaetaceae bacterium]
MRVVITMQNGKQMLFELFPDRAPITVANFLALIGRRFYDGLTFHRVVRDYVIQGGSANNSCICPTESTIIGEFAENGYDTGVRHTRGTISMARDEDFNSAGTQFFVVHRDAVQLDGRYAAFGRLLSGFDVLDAIAAVETAPPDEENRPLTPQVIASIRLDPTDLPRIDGAMGDIEAGR